MIRAKLTGTPEERLIVFSRYPVTGRTKTRLIPALGAGGAAELHRQMGAWTLRSARQSVSRGSCALQVYYTGGDAVQMAAWLGPDLDFCEQDGDDLGARLHNAFSRAFAEGAKRVAIVGTDCPGLTPPAIRKAFAMLRSHDVVLGPTDDGGYYLVGLRQPVAQLFGEIDWGTASVFGATIERAEAAGLVIGLLPSLRDVDTIDDLPVWTERGPCEKVETPVISIVIPALNEERSIAHTLSAITDDGDVEVIVVDGGSSDNTVSIADTYGAQVMCAARGRALQMNAGAASARGDILVFLHADTRLPQGYRADVTRILSEPGTSAGAFRFGIDGTRLAHRVIEWGANLRSCRWQMPYGDQAIFTRRETFDATGGFPEMPVLEDYELVRRLRRLGAVRIADSVALTSDRRWETRGAWRLTLRHALILLGYWLGIDTTRLAALRR